MLNALRHTTGREVEVVLKVKIDGYEASTSDTLDYGSGRQAKRTHRLASYGLTST